MSKFITLHETQTAYEAVKNALSKPQVAVIKENNDVHYGPLVKVNNVLLNKNELTLAPNATETLVATVLPVNASDKSVTWSSSDDSVATVSENGVVTAIGVGNTTITVTTVDGGYSAQCATNITGPMIDGHEYVEIGGLKWATMNVGATAVTDNGLYFAWGDSSGYTADQVGSGSGKKAFKEADYKYFSGVGTSSSAVTKYNRTDGKTTLDAEDDGVAVNWGGKWRMPTKAELQTLKNAVTTTWTSDYKSSGVSGLVLTDKTDSSKVLFFPAAGNGYYGIVDRVGSYGGYWTSSLNSSNMTGADCLSFFSSGNVSWSSIGGRFAGVTLRGVVSE